MEDKTKFQKVLEYLKGKGWTQEQLGQLTEELSKTVFSQFYTEAVSQLTDEDLQEIENCKNQEEANGKIKELYKKRTGIDPDEQAKKFYDDFSDKFMEEEQQKSSAQ